MVAAQHAVRVIRLGQSDRAEAATFERWTRAAFFRDVRALHNLLQPGTSLGRSPFQPFLRIRPVSARQHAKKNVGAGASLEMVPNRPFGERRFHVAKSILGAGEQDMDPPELVT